MIDISKVGTDGMRMTTKMIAEQALARGWNVWLHYEGGSHLRIQRTDGKQLELFSASLPTVLHTDVIRSNDKYFTTLHLREQGLPVPETYIVSVDDDQKALELAGNMFDTDKKVVVKPLDAGHGNGITVGVANHEQLRRALTRSKEFSPKAIIQEYFHEPVDIRMTCIDYKFVAALVRIPARVQGDGVHTVAELIDQANNSGERGEGYTSSMNIIDKDGAALYLADDINSIPPKGEWKQVIGTANVGTGGETLDVTDSVPEWLKQLAEQAAQSMNLPVCGVDFLVADTVTPDSVQAQLKPVIIEINQCPSLFIHEIPIHGKSRPVVATFLDYLETLK